MTREEAINMLQSIQADNLNALSMAIKALEQEPCEDCISRQQAICKMQELEDEDDDMYGCSIPEGFDGKRAIDALKALPSIQPKTGHWIHFASGDDCSECGWSTGKYISPSKYCPNCGTKMVEPQESGE